MINIRGNQYSRKHVTLDPSDAEFWNYSHHDSALDDYPVTIDYILHKTGQNKLFFVGYSMGTTQYLVLLSERPEYNEKIAAGFLLGPTAIGKHAANPLTLGSPYAEQMEAFVNWLGFYEIMPNFPKAKAWFALAMCDQSDTMRNLCRDVYSAIVGMEADNLDPAMVPTYISQMPAGCNSKTMTHLAQMYRNGEDFSWYDHGEAGNLVRYGHPHPARYKLGNVKVPTALFGGDVDELSAFEDLKILASRLPNLLTNHQVNQKGFGHLDFIFGVGAKNFVNIPVAEMIKSLVKD